MDTLHKTAADETDGRDTVEIADDVKQANGPAIEPARRVAREDDDTVVVTGKVASDVSSKGTVAAEGATPNVGGVMEESLDSGEGTDA